MIPEAENPFSHHPSPLQAGCKLQATGHCQDAALAFEAAAVVHFWTHQPSDLHYLKYYSTASQACFCTPMVLYYNGALWACIQCTSWACLLA